MQASASRKSLSAMRPALTSSLNRQTSVPEPTSRPLSGRSASARRRPRSPAGRSSQRPSAAPAWSCRSRQAAPRRRSGCRGSTPRRPCCEVAEEHRGRAQVQISPSDITGNSTGKPPASSTPRLTCSARPRKCALQGVSSDQVLQMPITGRPSKASGRHALVLHPAAVHHRVLAGSAEPALRPQLLGVSAHALRRFLGDATGSASSAFSASCCALSIRSSMARAAPARSWRRMASNTFLWRGSDGRCPLRRIEREPGGSWREPRR